MAQWEKCLEKGKNWELKQYELIGHIAIGQGVHEDFNGRDKDTRTTDSSTISSMKK